MMNVGRLFNSNMSIWVLSLVLACVAIFPAILDGQIELAAAVVVGAIAGTLGTKVQRKESHGHKE